LQLEEEAEACKGEGMFTVRIVGVDEERVVALASVRRNKSFWTRLCRGEREMVQPPR
jgi:hypothetical protein